MILKTRRSRISCHRTARFALARMLVSSDAQRITPPRPGTEVLLGSQRVDERETTFPITRRMDRSTFPITRHAWASRTIPTVRFGDHRPMANRNANLMRLKRTPESRDHTYPPTSGKTTCYREEPIVLFRSSASCYQILSTGRESPHSRRFRRNSASVTF